jgi:hypothetical protein
VNAHILGHGRLTLIDTAVEMLMIVTLEGIVAEAPSTPGSVWAGPVGAVLKVGSRIISVVEEERVQKHKCCA